MLKIAKLTTQKTISLMLGLTILLSPSINANSPSATTDKFKHKIPAFSATYNILRQGDVIGTVNRKLSYLGEQQAQYQTQSSIKWFIFSDNRTEQSLVDISSNKVTPISYRYTREGTGNDKDYQLKFSNAGQQVIDVNKNKVISAKLAPNSQDQLSHYLSLQLALVNHASPFKQGETFSFNVVKGSGKQKVYVHSYEGEEDLILPCGLTKAIKLKQENSSRSRVTYSWFAPSLNYQLVKIYQIKEGVEQFQTQLFEFNQTKK